MSKSHPPVRTFMASTVALFMRTDLPRELAMDYWRGPHAQLVARAPGRLEYRQHHFDGQSRGSWPAVDGVSTQIPSERRIDGMPEVTFQSPLAALQGRSHTKKILEDERNVFARTCLYITAPKGARWYSLPNTGPTRARTVVLVRRRATMKPRDFRAFIDETLGPALAAASGLTELRTQVFQPFRESMWKAPGVAHDNPPEHEHHAALFIGAADGPALERALEQASATVGAGKLREACSALHAYDVTAVYVYTRDGQPTLPQTKEEKKPPLAPVYRKLPPAPDPASRTLKKELGSARLIALAKPGSEDVVIDAGGRLICGANDGTILRRHPSAAAWETIGKTGGRPLGLEPMPDGSVLVCDARKGLLQLDPSTGAITPLVQYIDGIPLRYCSNATAATDGTIWFTESSNRFDFEHYMGALFEHRGSGRLFRRDPDGTVTVLLEGLHFPNGVTLDENEAAVIFAETSGYRISRLWVRGPRTGQIDVLADNLPGFPDNVSRMKGGRFWVAMTTYRDAGLDQLGMKPAWIRQLIWRLPDHLLPKGPRVAWAMAFDADGRVVDDRESTREDFSKATGVAEHDGHLYLAGVDEGSLLDVRLA